MSLALAYTVLIFSSAKRVISMSELPEYDAALALSTRAILWATEHHPAVCKDVERMSGNYLERGESGLMRDTPLTTSRSLRLSDSLCRTSFRI